MAHLQKGGNLPFFEHGDDAIIQEYVGDDKSENVEGDDAARGEGGGGGGGGGGSSSTVYMNWEFSEKFDYAGMLSQLARQDAAVGNSKDK